MLNDAFEALKQYDWGADMALLAPIEDAVVAAHGKADALKALEGLLLAALKSDISRDAKDYVCRKLAIVGSAAAVPTLAALLANKDQAHMARYALELMPTAEAGQALREALAKVSGALKVGVISSLGARRDTAAVAALGGLLADADAAVARAAAIALGDIGNVDAAKTLQAAKPTAAETKSLVIDAQLTCAESLLASNNKDAALAIYNSLVSNDQARLVRLAATRGMLACAGKSA